MRLVTAAAHFAAQGVIAGAYDVVIAAGVEAMSLVPMGASVMVPNVGLPYGPEMTRRYGLAEGSSCRVSRRR